MKEPECPCPHAAAVAERMKQRALHGLNKYGVTCARTDLTEAQWLNHAQEEAMDLAVYLNRLMTDLKKAQSIWMIRHIKSRKLWVDYFHKQEEAEERLSSFPFKHEWEVVQFRETTTPIPFERKNAAPPAGTDPGNRIVKCLACGENFNLREKHVCPT